MLREASVTTGAVLHLCTQPNLVARLAHFGQERLVIDDKASRQKKKEKRHKIPRCDFHEFMSDFLYAPTIVNRWTARGSNWG